MREDFNPALIICELCSVQLIIKLPLVYFFLYFSSALVFCTGGEIFCSLTAVSAQAAAFGDFFGRVTFVLCCCSGSVKCSILHLELRTKGMNYL